LYFLSRFFLFTFLVRRRRFILILPAAILVCVVAWLVFVPAPEPSYKGRTLSQWIEEYGKSQQRRGTSEPVEYFGTNALPYLLRWIQYEVPQYWTRPNRPLVQRLHKIKWLANSIEVKNRRAIGSLHAISQLGPRAAAAIPELGCMLQRQQLYQSQRPLFALAAIGPEALPTLLAALTNRNLDCRPALPTVLTRFRTNETVVRSLVDCLKDPDLTMRINTAGALSHMQADSNLVVPALIACLADTNPLVHAHAVTGLRNYGLPALTNILQKERKN